MKLKDKQIAIIGCGPGGLTLARLLQLQGASVTVYERDYNQEARLQGSPLDLHEDSGLKAMKQADLLKEFYANVRPNASKARIVSKDFELKFDEHSIQKNYSESNSNSESKEFRTMKIIKFKPSKFKAVSSMHILVETNYYQELKHVGGEAQESSHQDTEGRSQLMNIQLYGKTFGRNEMLKKNYIPEKVWHTRF